MKLQLRNVGDFPVLTISDLATEQNFQVLRAGITKTLQTGKNRIILELTESGRIPTEIVRQLAHLKLLANELSGDIVLVGSDPALKLRLDTFTQPPFVVCFPTAEKAAQFLKESTGPKAKTPPGPKPVVVPELTPPPAAPAPAAKPATPAPTAAAATPAASAPSAAPSSTEQLQKEFKEQIKAREQGELGQLRKENERLRAEIETMTKLLASKLMERREPGDIQGYRDKIVLLENQLADVLSKPPAKGP